MPTWDPEEYRRFEAERQQPVRDLIHRLDDLSPRRIIDLGCGPGTSTVWLRRRWPEAEVTGLDSSSEMLAAARSSDPEVRWVLDDLRSWAPTERYDLVFSNAALHWVAGHAELFPRLFSHAERGGALAVQIPANAASAHRRAVDAVASSAGWKDRWPANLERAEALPLDGYYSILAPVARAVELWETEYQHVLPGVDAIVDWIRGTALRPYLDALTAPTDRDRFLSDVRQALARAFPPRPDGRVLFPFRRRFIVARA